MLKTIALEIEEQQYNHIYKHPELNQRHLCTNIHFSTSTNIYFIIVSILSYIKTNTETIYSFSMYQQNSQIY